MEYEDPFLLRAVSPAVARHLDAFLAPSANGSGAVAPAALHLRCDGAGQLVGLSATMPAAGRAKAAGAPTPGPTDDRAAASGGDAVTPDADDGDCDGPGPAASAFVHTWAARLVLLPRRVSLHVSSPPLARDTAQTIGDMTEAVLVAETAEALDAFVATHCRPAPPYRAIPGAGCAPPTRELLDGIAVAPAPLAQSAAAAGLGHVGSGSTRDDTARGNDRGALARLARACDDARLPVLDDAEGDALLRAARGVSDAVGRGVFSGRRQRTAQRTAAGGAVVRMSDVECDYEFVF